MGAQHPNAAGLFAHTWFAWSIAQTLQHIGMSGESWHGDALHLSRSQAIRGE